jgi:hypothetical protein
MHTLLCNFTFLGSGLVLVGCEQLSASGCVNQLLCCEICLNKCYADDVMNSSLMVWCLKYSFALGSPLVNLHVIYG